MQILDRIRADCIKVPLRATVWHEAIDELVALLVAAREIEAEDPVAERIKADESELATADRGIALPHGVSNTAPQRCLAIGKLQYPILWGTKDPKEVSLVFLYVVPQAESASRILITKELSDTVHSEQVLCRLREAESSLRIFNMLNSVGTAFEIPDGFSPIGLLRGHLDVIHSIAWARDGRKLASGGAGTDQGRLWDIVSGTLVASLGGHGGPVYSVTWSPDGQALCTGSADKVIRIWEASGLRLSRRMVSGDEVYAASWSPDGSAIAVASHLCMLRLWDPQTGTPHPGLEEAMGLIGYCATWSPDGRFIAAGGGRMEPAIKIWDRQSRRLQMSLAVPTDAVYALGWSPNGRVLASGLSNGSIVIYDTKTWRRQCVLKGHKAQITGMDISCDSSFLASKADDGSVILWDLERWEMLTTLPEFGEAHRLFGGLAFHPHTLMLATLGEGGRAIRIWHLDRKMLLGEQHEPSRRPAKAAGEDSPSASLGRKEQAGTYDVFLCHNSMDKDEVMAIGRRLKDRGLLPWLDEWNVRPGTSWLSEIQGQIENIRSAAVFVGENGTGPWQRREINALLRQFVDRACPVIPVILASCTQAPAIPALLGDIQWVDFRLEDPDPLIRLIWGITGCPVPGAMDSQ